MTQDERQEIHARVKVMIDEAEHHAAQDAPKVKAPPQEEDTLAAELQAVRLIFTQLEPMTPRGRDRVLTHIVNYLHEMEARERHDLALFTEGGPGEVNMMAPQSMGGREERRR